jgi:hypothetical protein
MFQLLGLKPREAFKASKENVDEEVENYVTS